MKKIDDMNNPEKTAVVSKELNKLNDTQVFTDGEKSPSPIKHQIRNIENKKLVWQLKEFGVIRSVEWTSKTDNTKRITSIVIPDNFIVENNIDYVELIAAIKTKTNSDFVSLERYEPCSWNSLNIFKLDCSKIDGDVVIIDCIMPPATDEHPLNHIDQKTVKVGDLVVLSTDPLDLLETELPKKLAGKTVKIIEIDSSIEEEYLFYFRYGNKKYCLIDVTIDKILSKAKQNDGEKSPSPKPRTRRAQILHRLATTFNSRIFSPQEAKNTIHSIYLEWVDNEPKTYIKEATAWTYFKSLVGNTRRIYSNNNPNGRIGTMKRRGLDQNATLIYKVDGGYRCDLKNIKQFNSRETPLAQIDAAPI